MKLVKIAAAGLALACIGAPCLADHYTDYDRTYADDYETNYYVVQTYPSKPHNEVDRFSRGFNHETNMASKRFNQNVNNFSKWFNGRLKIRRNNG